ncbi:MAG: VirB4 family type IV secretion system protein [Vicinamibacterales bacterium]
MTRIVRDYRESGAANELLAVWGFVGDGTFVTKAGHVGVGYRVGGVDLDGQTADQRQSLARRMEAALRLLDERVRASQYLLKRVHPPFVAAPCRLPVPQAALERRARDLNARVPALHVFEHVLVLLYEPSSLTATGYWRRQSWREVIHRTLSAEHTVALLEAELERAVTTLHRVAASVEVQLSEVGLTRLGSADTFQFLRRLANYDADVLAAVPATPTTHLDYFTADSAVECERDHLRVGRRHVRVLSMREAPAKTFAQLLTGLLAVPGEFVACFEWQRIAPDRMRRDIQTRRRHFFNKRVSLVNYVAPDTRPEEMLVDDSATATVRALGDALTDIEVHGHIFGACSLTLVLHGEEPRAVQHASAEARKVLAAHDGAFFEETYNLLNAWLAVMPGNGAHNLRRLALLETHAADLSFLFTVDTGSRGDGAWRAPGAPQPPLAIFETPHGTPFAFHLHDEDVGHTLVLGATGSGKSFLLNFLITHAQQFDPFTIVLDLGHSYRRLAGLLGASYVTLGLRHDSVRINPFALSPSPESLHFLHAFVRVLLEGQDGYRLSDLEDRELYEAIDSLYVLDRPQRRLFTLANLLPRALSGRLAKWVDGGRYAALFDNVEDTLSFSRLQVFDFEAMREFPAPLEPLLFYVLHRVNAEVVDPAAAATLKLCVMDEAWRFIQHPRLRAYVQEALKTWRKRHAAMILATQSIDDFASADLLRAVVESCPTKLLLANPAVDRRQYAELFQLNEEELALVAGLTPKRQLLLKRPRLTKVLTLTVDAESARVFGTTPVTPSQSPEADRLLAVTRGTVSSSGRL